MPSFFLSIQPFGYNRRGLRITWTASLPAPVNFEYGVAVPPSVGELDAHLSQRCQGRGLPACQVSSLSLQLFGHSAPTSQTGQDNGSIA